VQTKIGTANNADDFVVGSGANIIHDKQSDGWMSLTASTKKVLKIMLC
jgi:hypothetical protein